MELLVLLLIIGLLFGLGGLFTTAKWLIVIALIIWLFGFFTYGGRR